MYIYYYYCSIEHKPIVEESMFSNPPINNDIIDYRIGDIIELYVYKKWLKGKIIAKYDSFYDCIFFDTCLKTARNVEPIYMRLLNK